VCTVPKCIANNGIIEESVEALPGFRSQPNPGQLVATVTCPTFSNGRFPERWLFGVKEEPMRKSRFSDEQMVAILREADRTTVTAAAKKNKVSEQPIYAWRKQFGQLEPTDVKALKALSSENAKLKKLLAERDLAIEVMKEINRKKW
jgi:putative transposase